MAEYPDSVPYREELISISEEDEALLVATRGGATYVIDLLARTARPGRGAAQLLRALGQIAKVAIEVQALHHRHWFFGRLTVQVSAAGAGLTLDIMTEHLGRLEALFDRTYFGVPFEELRWMVERVPELAGPLRLRTDARSASMTLFVPPMRAAEELVRADDTAKIVVSPESLLDPDSTSPVPALMEELAARSIPSHLDPREL